VLLGWTPPTLDVDGNPLVGPIGFRVHLGAAQGIYDEVKEAGLSSSLSLSLTAGTWYLAVTAYNLQGQESDLSEEITVLQP
jgi:hypothetical protein